VRAVLDPNVLISALLSPGGSPARLVRAWIGGHFELIVSPHLLAELERALAYPKLRKRIDAEDARAFVVWLSVSATLCADPVEPSSISSPDPNDDYLITLAATQAALLVSGDAHLLGLVAEMPVVTAAAYLTQLGLGG
jgi:putative PIN family toxin of toxin-antitoxin system